MPWNDDSWKDGYDSWKLAPDDEYDDPCDHEDYQVDILEGRARCDRCGESWYCSDEEVLRQIEHEAAYAAWEEKENRRQWWSDALYAVRHPLAAIHWELQKRQWFGMRIGKREPSDDDIPF
jgi:hypothetical protein